MRAYLLLALALFASGCADPPTAAPTPIPPADPEPSAVSVEIDQTTARVGEIITITYRLAPPLDRSVDIWTEVNPPTGETRENGPIDWYLDRPHQGRTAPGWRRARRAIVLHVHRRPVRDVFVLRDARHLPTSTQGASGSGRPLLGTGQVPVLTLTACDSRRQEP